MGRQEYLSRTYEVLSRIATPGHTLINFQCWNWDTDQSHRAANTHRDMQADFEPFFDIIHSEQCGKNQGGDGWCFYMKMKPLQVQDQVFERRLQLQKAAQTGDVEYLRKNLDGQP